MDRAQAAHGRSLGRSCCLNRFTTRGAFDGTRCLRASCVIAAGTGGTLPSSTEPSPWSNDEGNDQGPEEEVALWELWQHLPRTEQVRFGACFSRMVLKILTRCNGQDLEECS